MTRTTPRAAPAGLCLLALSVLCVIDPSQAAAPAVVPPKDLHGDALPAGAFARGGTVRFRHASSAIAYSPDGKLLASGGHDNHIRLFDAATGKEVRRLAGHRPRTYEPESDPRDPFGTLLSVVGPGFVCSVAFSPDGKTLASGGWDDYVRLWDVKTGKEVRKIDAHQAMVARVVFSPDGKFLASRGGLDGMAKLWDPQTGTLLHKFTGLSPINPWRFNHDSALAISPDSKTVAVTARKAIVTYDAATGAERRRVEAHNYGICLAYSPDGKVLASGGVDPGKDVYTLRLWDAAGGKELRRCTLPKNEPPTYLAFSPKNSNHLAAVIAEDVMHVFDVTTGKEAFPLRHYWPSRVAYSPDGKTIASAGSGPVVRHWDAENGKELFLNYDGHQSGVRGVALSKDGSLAASAGEQVRLWEVKSGKVKHRLPGAAAAVAFSGDGKLLASAGNDRIVRLWDVEKGKLVRELKGHRHPLCAVAFSADGKLVASGDVQCAVRIWGVEGKERRLIEYKSGTEAMSLAFSPDGKTLACAGAWNDSSFLPKPGTVIDFNGKKIKIDGPIVIQGVVMTRREGHRVLLWDVGSGKEVRHFSGLSDKIDAAAFSPDGKTLAAASRDGKVCLWSADTGKLRLAINAHPGQAESAGVAPGVGFTADGKALVTASGDRTLRVWDASTGLELRQYQADGPLTCLAVGRDGRTAVTGGGDAGVLFWDVNAPPPQRRKGRNVITLR